MKQLFRLVLASGVFLAGCVSTSTFEEKESELTACRKQAGEAAAQAKSDLGKYAGARAELETKLAAVEQELATYRLAAQAQQRQVDTLQIQETDLRERLSKELADKNVEIQQLKGQLSVRMLDRIVFKSGSADILPEGKEALDKLAAAVKDTTDTIRVEGHTDDAPISDRLKAKYPSNWELSAARASAVARYFETTHFINPKRLESLGFSMHHPIAPNDTPENKLRNRRVEIVLKPAAEAEPTKEPSPAALPAPETKP